MKKEFDDCIENLFKYSERTQPNKKVNIAASVADSTALVLSAAMSYSWICFIVIPVSEVIAFTKNFYDTHTASQLRKNYLSQLRSIKAGIIHKLKTNKVENAETKKSIDETNKLFSEIEQKSKAGLRTTLSYRLQGFACSIIALALGLTILKPVVDWVSGMIDGLVLAQPIQPQPYPAHLIANTIKLVLGMISYITCVYLILDVWEYNNLRRKTSTLKREQEKQQLKEKVGELLKKLS